MLHSRPTFDLNASSRHTRLHHSPSLPNIWFPTRSRPPPQDVLSSTTTNLSRPSTPSNKVQMSSTTKAFSPSQKTNDSHTQTTSTQSFRSRRSKKARMHYITPPLTPASSIKTTGSVDSTGDSADTTEDDFFCDADKSSSRFFAVCDFDKQADKNALERAVLEALRSANFEASSSAKVSEMIKFIDGNVLQSSGELLLVFHDIRHARAAHSALGGLESGQVFSFVTPQAKRGLSVYYLTPEEAVKKLSTPSIVGEVDGGFYLTATAERHGWEGDSSTKSGEINVRSLKTFLRSFGVLRSFTFVRDHLENKIPAKTFRVEFYDSREAVAAYEGVQNTKAFGMAFSVYGRSASHTTGSSNGWTPHSPVEPEVRDSRPSDAPAMIYSSRTNNTTNDLFTPSSQFTSAPTDITPTPETLRAPQWEGELRTEHPLSPCANPTQSCTYCPSRRTPHSHSHIFPYHMPPTPSPQPIQLQHPIPVPPPPPHRVPVPAHHMVMSAPPMAAQPIPIEFNYPPHMYGYPAQWAGFDANGKTGPPPPPHAIPTMAFCQWPIDAADQGGVSRMPMQFGQVECHFPTGMPGTMQPGMVYQMPPSPPSTAEHRRHSTPSHPTPSPTLANSFGQMSLGGGHGLGGAEVYSSAQGGGADVASKNQLVISRIESGQDTRTTVMIKNIPNKMSDKDLIAYIAKVCPRRIDFLYLRMDFQNGCNVGYAFVNFIEAQDLLKFAKSRLGEKWNMFSSEKVLQMSYANYQGKEALVEKFKNSCIMDEREAWRPKIFYSFGPNQGLLEPFPAPTHIRRKERSSFNRGALYVSSLHTRGAGLNNAPLGHRQGGEEDGRESGRGMRRRSGAAA